MLYTIAVVLLILWLLGLVTATTMGGFIHILLVVAIVMVLLRVISGHQRRCAQDLRSSCFANFFFVGLRGGRKCHTRDETHQCLLHVFTTHHRLSSS